MKGISAETRKLLDSWKCGARQTRGVDQILIAHLGNLSGANPDCENSLPYLQAALNQGYHVCCNVVFRGAFLLPVATGFESVSASFLARPRVWCRTGDAVTLDALCGIGAHVVPAATPTALTSAQFVWSFPDVPLTPRSIAVFPELARADWLLAFEHAGICSDEISRYL